jgi:protein-tyrosine phosphatase
MTKTVVFVCTANMCRSPMAEGLFRKIVEERKRGGEIIVGSAGTSDMHSSHATEKAVEVMRERGIDIASHRSRFVSRGILEEATIVACMTGDHKQFIERFFPEYRAKVHLLSELADGRVMDVPDPVGGGLDTYRGVADLMQGMLVRLADRI